MATIDYNFLALLAFVAFIIWVGYRLTIAILNKFRNNDPAAPRERDQ